MRPSMLWRSGLAVAGGLLLVPGTAPLPLASEGAGAVQLSDARVIGNLVEVALLNLGSGPLTGRLFIEVVAAGESTLIQVPFAVHGGQKVFVRGSAPAPIDRVVRVGVVVDDGAPF